MLALLIPSTRPAFAEAPNMDRVVDADPDGELPDGLGEDVVCVAAAAADCDSDDSAVRKDQRVGVTRNMPAPTLRGAPQNGRVNPEKKQQLEPKCPKAKGLTRTLW